MMANKHSTDRTPQIRAAGVTHVDDPNQSADRCLKPDNFPRDKPKNKFTVNDQASIVDARITKNLHNNPHLEEYRRMTHGCEQMGADHVRSDGVFSVDKRPQLLQEFDSRREEQYHRKDFAPLGKSIVRGHHLPENINTPDHVFGVSTKFSDTQIKDLITPSKEAGAHLSAEEQAAVRDMYIKSHKSYAPGEQWHRQYKWTDAQLMATWGAPSAQAKSAEETVKDSLKWAADTERNLRANITSKHAQDFRERTQAQLGKVHDPRQYRSSLDSAYTFGVASKRDTADASVLINPHDASVFDKDPPPMRQISVDPITHLLQGPTGRKAAQQQQQQQQPSAKALRAAAVPLGQARHLPDLLPSDHASHVYGIPSIRHDIHRPARQSLADFQNYGDEFGCKVLMNHHDTRKLYLEAELKQRGL